MRILFLAEKEEADDDNKFYDMVFTDENGEEDLDTIDLTN